MRRLLLSLVIAGVLLLPFGVAQATPPTLSSGTYADRTVQTTVVRSADGNTVLILEKEGWLTGTAEGRIRETMYVVGKRITTFHGIQICSDPCIVGGRSGTYVARVEGTSDPYGIDRGTWVYVSGTGDLANLRGHGTIEGTSAPDGASGTYSGEYHFDP